MREGLDGFVGSLSMTLDLQRTPSSKPGSKESLLC